MPYLLLIYSNEEIAPLPGSEAFMHMNSQFSQLSKELENNGLLITGEPLESITTKTTVKIREGEHIITDDNNHKDQESLIGYYLLNCKNLDEAIHYATKIPAATYGSIEIINQFFYDSLSNSIPTVRLNS